jgi:1-acyl-sn-glycerol-3-phosphate acyltransferase
MRAASRLALRAEREWRRMATGLCFLSFGLMGLWFGLLACPLLALVVRDTQRRAEHGQRWLGAIMRFFLWEMASLRVLSYRIEGASALARPGALVVANHPSLIDAILVMAAGGGMTCVAKAALFHHPVLGTAVRALGFVDNSSTAQMLDSCVDALRAGGRVLAFPEGSRTVPGKPPVLQRGAARIAVQADCTVVPVTIRVSEPTLYKGARWWGVPRRRPHFTVTVHPALEPQSFASGTVHPAVATRRLNQQLQQLFMQETSSHGSA